MPSPDPGPSDGHRGESSRRGKVETIGLPIKLSETPGGVQRPSPLYGEHTREVLLESGYDGIKSAPLKIAEVSSVMMDDR